MASGESMELPETPADSILEGRFCDRTVILPYPAQTSEEQDYGSIQNKVIVKDLSKFEAATPKEIVGDQITCNNMVDCYFLDGKSGVGILKTIGRSTHQSTRTSIESILSVCFSHSHSHILVVLSQTLELVFYQLDIPNSTFQSDPLVVLSVASAFGGTAFPQLVAGNSAASKLGFGHIVLSNENKLVLYFLDTILSKSPNEVLSQDCVMADYAGLYKISHISVHFPFVVVGMKCGMVNVKVYSSNKLNDTAWNSMNQHPVLFSMASVHPFAGSVYPPIIITVNSEMEVLRWYTTSGLPEQKLRFTPALPRRFSPRVRVRDDGSVIVISGWHLTRVVVLHCEPYPGTIVGVSCVDLSTSLLDFCIRPQGSQREETLLCASSPPNLVSLVALHPRAAQLMTWDSSAFLELSTGSSVTKEDLDTEPLEDSCIIHAVKSPILPLRTSAVPVPSVLPGQRVIQAALNRIDLPGAFRQPDAAPLLQTARSLSLSSPEQESSSEKRGSPLPASRDCSMAPVAKEMVSSKSVTPPIEAQEEANVHAEAELLSTFKELLNIHQAEVFEKLSQIADSNNEVKTAINHLADCVQEKSLTRRDLHSLESQLNSLAQSAALAAAVQSSTPPEVQKSSVEQMVRESFVQIIGPGLEALIKASMESTFLTHIRPLLHEHWTKMVMVNQKQISDCSEHYVRELHQGLLLVSQQMKELLPPTGHVNEANQALVDQLQSLHVTSHNTTENFLSKLFADFSEKLKDHTTEQVLGLQKLLCESAPPRKPVVTVEELLVREDYCGALQLVLNQRDQDALETFVTRINPMEVFNGNKLPYPVILSLVQQLSMNLKTSTGKKIDYLMEAMVTVDKTDTQFGQLTVETFQGLANDLEACIGDPSMSAYDSSIRFLAHNIRKTMF